MSDDDAMLNKVDTFFRMMTTASPPAARVTNLKEMPNGLAAAENKDIPTLSNVSDIALDKFTDCNTETQKTARKHTNLKVQTKKATSDKTMQIDKKQIDEKQELYDAIQSEKRQVEIIVSAFVDATANKTAKNTAKEFIDCNAFGAHMSVIGRNVQSTASLAIKLGGDAKSWSKVASFGQGLDTFASGFQSIQATQSFSLDFCLGYWGAALGALSVVVAILNDDNDNESDEQEFRQQLFSALQDIYKALQNGFKRVESILLDCVCQRLAHISQRLVRIEEIMCASFRDLHRKDLLDIADTIRKDWRGEFIQNNRERRDLLRRLSTWIDCHCAASFEIAENRIETDCLTIFNEIVSEAADPTESIGFFVRLVLTLVPDYTPGAVIPNLALCLYAANIFVLASGKWNLDGFQVHMLYERIAATCANVDKAIESMDNNVVDSLIRQHAHFRRLVGRALAAAHIELGDQGKTMRDKMSQFAAGDIDCVNRLLDSMELRRLVLLQIAALRTLDSTKMQQIDKLQSKEAFMLERQSDEAITPNRGAHPHLGWPEYQGSLYQLNTPVGAYRLARDGYRLHMKLQWFLDAGLNVNSHCGWGTVFAHYAQNEKFRAADMHQLLLCNEIQCDTATAFVEGCYNRGGPAPLDLLLSNNNFQALLIFVASGRDVKLSQHTLTTNKDSIACHEFIAAMESKNSFLYRDKLRAAYKYFKQYESGIGKLTFTGDKKSLFVLAVLIGTVPHNVHFDFNLDDIILPCGMNWFALAHKAGNGSICNYLVNRGMRNQLIYWWGKLRVEDEERLRKPTSIAVEYGPAVSTAFQIFLNAENKRYSSLSSTSKESCKVKSKQTDQFAIWIDLLRPICNVISDHLISSVFADISQVCEQNKRNNAEQIAPKLNLLNALLKQTANYQLGPNIDYFLANLKND
jgi:hypothetical protein